MLGWLGDPGYELHEAENLCGSLAWFAKVWRSRSLAFAASRGSPTIRTMATRRVASSTPTSIATCSPLRASPVPRCRTSPAHGYGNAILASRERAATGVDLYEEPLAAARLNFPGHRYLRGG